MPLIESHQMYLPVIRVAKLETVADLDWLIDLIRNTRDYHFTNNIRDISSLRIDKDGTGLVYDVHRSGYGDTIDTSTYTLCSLGAFVVWNTDGAAAILGNDCKNTNGTLNLAKIPKELLQLTFKQDSAERGI